MTAYSDLALHLVACHACRRRPWPAPGRRLLDPGRARQTPYMNLLSTAADDAVARACRWLEDNHARPVRIGELAEATHLTERTLLRRFRKAMGRSPSQYLQAVRASNGPNASWRREANRREIASKVGMPTPRLSSRPSAN